MFRAFLLIATFLTGMIHKAHAHIGMETESIVRIKKDSMTLITHAAPQIAWKLLGPNAPKGPLNTAFTAAKPALEKQASSLFELQSDGITIKPISVRVTLELDHHIAFVVTYPRATEKTLTLRATFLAKLDALERTSLHFFNDSGSTFRRDAEPFTKLSINSSRQLVSFSSTSARVLTP
jgi:hypothetical protein